MPILRNFFQFLPIIYMKAKMNMKSRNVMAGGYGRYNGSGGASGVDPNTGAEGAGGSPKSINKFIYNIQKIHFTSETSILALGIMGCSSLEPLCRNPIEELKLLTPKEGFDVSKYDMHINGVSTIYTDKKIPPNAAKYFLEQIPKWENQILSLITDSPYKNGIIVYLQDREKCFCFREAQACAMSSGIFVCFEPEDYESPDFIDLYSGPVVHELSHWYTLTPSDFFIEPFGYFIAQQILPGPIAEKAPKVFSSAVSVNDVIQFNDNMSSWLKLMEITGISSDEISIRYCVKIKVMRDNGGQEDFEDKYFSSVFKTNKPYQLGDVVLFLDTINSELPVLRIYKTYNDEKTYMVSKYIPLCLENSYITDYENLPTEEGGLVFPRGPEQLYYKYQSGTNIEDLPDDERIQFMHTSMCFLYSMGDNVFKRLMQSMVEFSRNHQTKVVKFPFFSSFMLAAGMNEDTAKAYFDRFHMPIDEGSYRLGGVCWD